ncbi:MAG TPA: DMT family transporter [Limnochordales bacterium]
MDAAERRPHLVLAIGVLAVSSAAIWVRLSALPPSVLAFYRLFFSALGLAPVLLVARRSRSEPRPGAGVGKAGRDWVGWAALAGASLAAHWAVWFASLARTSVLSSTVLVTTQPVWVVLLARALWGERLGRGRAAALAVALAGSATVAVADGLRQAGAPAAGPPHSLGGDGLALLAAVLVSVYLLVGQRLRARVPLAEYLAVVYAAGAAVLLAVNLLLGQPVWGWPGRELAIALGLAVVPTLVGHSALNLVIARLGAATVATAILGEPVGASLLALLLFGEVPGILHGAGAALVLAGIYRFTAPARPAARGEGEVHAAS